MFFLPVVSNAQIDNTPKKKTLAIRKDFYEKMPRQARIFCDFTKSLNPSQLEIMDSLWVRFYRSSNKGIVTAILDSGRIPENDFYSFADAMFQSWNMNDDKNAIYIIASPALKHVRIFTGESIKLYLSDEKVQSIISSIIIPRFKDGTFFEAIKMGTEEIINTIKLNGG